MDREAAYADAVAALLDATPDDAQSTFDDVLAAAVAAGLEPAVARSLRWWQRESTRAVRDHAAAVLPALICGLLDSPAGERRPEPRLAVALEPTEQEEPTEEEPTEQEEPVAADERRRVLVAGLLALDDSASA